MLIGTPTSLNKRPTRGTPPVDGILAERFVDHIRRAPIHVGPEVRAVVMTPNLDIEHEADRDLLAVRPGLDVNRLARQAGDPVLRRLTEGRHGCSKKTEEHQKRGQ